MKSIWFGLAIGIVIWSSCHPVKLEVEAAVETTPVINSEDAADDAAIFIHPTDSEKSLIIGTNKQSGLVLYSLQGEQLEAYNIGRVNNVDIIDYPSPNEEATILIGGSNRTDNTISIKALDPQTSKLSDILREPLQSKVDEVYGFCFYQGEQTYAMVIGKDGVLEQWLLSWAKQGKVKGEVVRTFDVGGQCEGLVADHELGYLYIAEEEEAIWRYAAEPSGGDDRVLVDRIKENGNLRADLEGLCLYYAAGGKGYLLASSQGNNSYAVYDRAGDNPYLGSFRIKHGELIDGTSETDGIDVTNLKSGDFANGFFIVQDGHNRLKGKKENQNFKIVPWESIANSFSPPLHIDNNYIKQPNNRLSKTQ
ncbi:MAG: phytase [Saprospiraceae bacterium]|nr:phytase [Saprospiraceae bacterium]